MRAITKETVGAFYVNRACRLGNTQSNGSSLFLHGNEIAKWTSEGLMITNAGWATNTTKERLK